MDSNLAAKNHLRCLKSPMMPSVNKVSQPIAHLKVTPTLNTPNPNPSLHPELLPLLLATSPLTMAVLVSNNARHIMLITNSNMAAKVKMALPRNNEPSAGMVPSLKDLLSLNPLLNKLLLAMLLQVKVRTVDIILLILPPKTNSKLVKAANHNSPLTHNNPRPAATHMVTHTTRAHTMLHT